MEPPGSGGRHPVPSKRGWDPRSTQPRSRPQRLVGSCQREVGEEGCLVHTWGYNFSKRTGVDLGKSQVVSGVDQCM